MAAHISCALSNEILIIVNKNVVFMPGRQACFLRRFLWVLLLGGPKEKQLILFLTCDRHSFLQIIHLIFSWSSFVSWLLFLVDLGLIGFLGLHAYKDSKFSAHELTALLQDYILIEYSRHSWPLWGSILRSTCKLFCWWRMSFGVCFFFFFFFGTMVLSRYPISFDSAPIRLFCTTISF